MRYSTFLEVNLGLLQDNLNKIKRLSKARILPMVKADAYGNGLVPVAKFLVEDCEMKTLGCATLGEALHLFNQCPDLNTEVLIFSDSEISNPKVNDAYFNFAITPVLHQANDVETVLSNPSMAKLPVILKVNTGMNRLGLSLEEVAKFAPRLKSRGVKHLMTHFARSSDVLKEGDKTHKQMEEFNKAKQILKEAGVNVQETSVANSGAIEQKFGSNETFIRPGLMLYGPYSVEPRIWDGHQVSRLVSKILNTFMVKKGTPVGYGVNVAPEDGLIVIIPVGYADLSVTTASGAEITINGYKGKIFARVSMDMMFLLFDPSVNGKLKAGDAIEFWNNDNRVIGELSTSMKTIPYHLMCGVTNRIPRIYKVK
ncbi:MAG: alanine racemase [Bdellovibrionales bacterium]|nr:alanine racemase [Bdellovibrionales bacterium]